MWAYVVAAALALHGLIHVLGFTSTWRVGKMATVSAAPTFLGRAEPDTPTVQLLGAAWLAVTVAFLAAAVALAAAASWWAPLTGVAALASLGLCIAWWKDAKVGVLIDAAILAGLVVMLFVNPEAL